MTKLMQWLIAGVLFLSIWLSFATKKINNKVLEEYSTAVLFFPVILLLLFGAYAGIVILWRVYTFNDCKEAALELKQQIEEAKIDLKKKGFKFDDSDT